LPNQRRSSITDSLRTTVQAMEVYCRYQPKFWSTGIVDGVAKMTWKGLRIGSRHANLAFTAFHLPGRESLRGYAH
jgi:hypothetical protein